MGGEPSAEDGACDDACDGESAREKAAPKAGERHQRDEAESDPVDERHGLRLAPARR